MSEMSTTEELLPTVLLLISIPHCLTNEVFRILESTDKMAVLNSHVGEDIDGGILGCYAVVLWVFTDVSEDRIASIFRPSRLRRPLPPDIKADICSFFLLLSLLEVLC
jgi:hypothetical protein